MRDCGTTGVPPVRDRACFRVGGRIALAALLAIGPVVLAQAAPAEPLFGIELTPGTGTLDTVTSFTTAAVCPPAQPFVVASAVSVPVAPSGGKVERLTLRAPTRGTELERAGTGYAVPMSSSWREAAVAGKAPLPLTGRWAVAVSCVADATAAPGPGQATLFVAEIAFTPLAAADPPHATYEGLTLRALPMTASPASGSSGTSTRFTTGPCGPNDTHAAFLAVPVSNAGSGVRVARLDGGGVLVGPVPLSTLRSGEGYALTLVQWKELRDYLRMQLPLNTDLYQAFICLPDSSLHFDFGPDTRAYVSLLRFTPTTGPESAHSDYVALEPSTVVPIYGKQASAPSAPTPTPAPTASPPPPAAGSPTPTPSAGSAVDPTPTAEPSQDAEVDQDVLGAVRNRATADRSGLPFTGWAATGMLAAAAACLLVGRGLMLLAGSRRRR